MISCVIPCYNEEAALPYFLPEIQAVAEEIGQAWAEEFEFLFVDDGSKDGTLELLRGYALEDPRVRYLSFSRNFGKESAMYAGLKYARGEYVVVMDADLQHPPALLPEMYEMLQVEEYDCVATRRVTRTGEPPVRSFFAHRFYKLINRISETEFIDGACDFRMMKRTMVDAILAMGEYNRFSKGIFGWVGFRTKWIPFENQKRVAGETKWSFWKLLRYSLQGITAFSTAPLVISSVLGIVMCIVALGWILVTIVQTLVLPYSPPGYPTLMCLILMIGGLNLLCIGILGQYLAKTYLETKRRPIYIMAETSLQNVQVERRPRQCNGDGGRDDRKFAL